MSQFILPRRRFLQGAAALGGLTLAGPLRAQTPVNFQLSWLPSVQFGGSYIALDKGYWAEDGLQVALQAGGPNAPVEPPVVAGRALMGISAADYTAAAVEQGAPFKIIAVAMQKNPFAIASLSANPVTEPKDLEGKSIGMATANVPVLRALCQINGVDFDKIEVVPTQYDAAPLVSGQVDCILCWKTDLPVAMTVAGVENTVMLLADYGYSVHSQTYIATEDSIANNRATLLALLPGRAARLERLSRRHRCGRGADGGDVPRQRSRPGDPESSGGRAGRADVLRADRCAGLWLVHRGHGGGKYRDAGAAGARGFARHVGPLAAGRPEGRRTLR